MNSIALELRTRCQGCGQTISINACVDKLVCNACKRETPLGADAWAAVLDDAIADKGGADTVVADAGDLDITVTYAAAVASCPKCKAVLPDEASAFSVRGWTVCPACGTKLSIRTAPPALVDLGATILIGEDLEPHEPAGAAAIVMTPCLGCKAPLRLDGATRLAPCATCGVANYLTTDLWQHFHPVKPAIRWFACVTREMTGVQPAVEAFASMAPAPRIEVVAYGSNPQAAASDGDDDDADPDEIERRSSWSSLESVVVDAGGRFYCGGEVGWSDDAIWCMGNDLEPIWSRTDLDMSDIRVALDVQHGRVLAWMRNKHSAILLSAADGSTIGPIGGREPSDAKVHALDLEHCKYLLGDLDGTWLGLFDNRLARFDAHGGGLPLWPPHGGLFGPKAEKPLSLYEEDGRGKRSLRRFEDVSIENVGNHPHVIDDYAHLAIGWDGRLYVEYQQWIAAFDRAGKRVYKIKLPIDDVSGDHLAADAQGNLYVRGRLSGDPDQRLLLRVSPDGSRIDTVSNDRRQGGGVGDEDEVVTSPDGTVHLIDSGMCMRIFAPDGRLAWQSPKSKDDDVSEDRDAARRA